MASALARAPRGPRRTRHVARKIDAERHLVRVQHQLMSGTYVTPEAGRISRREFADVYLARQPWRSGFSVKAVQRALGHASAATTLDLYAHMWPGDDDRIRQAANGPPPLG